MTQTSEADFFDPELLVEDPRSEVLFGINDGDPSATSRDQRRAYTISEGSGWNATVHNKQQVKLQFTPLDHNVQLDGLCDGILYTCGESSSQLIFIELKSKGKRWIQEGVEQLKKTISIYKAGEGCREFSEYKAYLCNNRHPHFQFSKKEEMQKFRQETSMRLYIEQQIQIGNALSQ